ncbi:MAG TPA: YetF domain-containing protein, partial [Planctomycetota bacterium]|nr:YetF domain-containing protein [Planctomycetota bacterium]
ILLSLAKRRFPKVEKVMDGVPVLLIEKGRVHRERMAKERIDEDDILAAGRERLGIGTLDDIDYAVLEQSGGISVIPKAK